ncbi:MAG: hypothetical protein J6N21_21735 [Butyrivibrio sp.]|nr:hypothetical protein [Butyrivibrio sp.]
MEREEKTRIAITAGIAGVILLILILFLALSGDNGKNDNAIDYSSETSSEEPVASETSSSFMSTVSEENSLSADLDSSKEPSSAASSSASLSTGKSTVSGNSFYSTDKAVLKNLYKKVTYDKNSQMQELLTYASENNQEAIRDLAHLERFEAMSFSLEGKDDFYYAGETDSDGLPNGFGVAAYANDQYYYGEWKNGVRSGQGTWISFYPQYNSYVVKEHMYSGEWDGDLPNGNGQEHYDYNYEYMNNADIYLQNAIGNFKDGLYNGEMYIITVDLNGETKEWIGNCNSGTWQKVSETDKDKRGNSAVLSERENLENHIWMSDEKAKDNGVSGIIFGGSRVE